MKKALAIVAIVLAVDVFGFCLWSLSGQMPVDNFYIGTITTHVIQLIKN